jgi:hypothetical protein
VVISSSTANIADGKILLGDMVNVKIFDFSNFSLKANVI